jgi:hypothetical protein
MTSLRKRLTPDQIEERRLSRLAEEVARKLLNEPMPSMPPCTGNSPKELGAHRIQEINMKTDLGYPWSKGSMMAEHHMHNAISTIETFLNNWAFNVSVGPVNKAFALPAGIVLGLRERLDPALYVAIAELDEGSELSCEYDQLEATTLDQIETTLAGYTAIPARCRSKKIKKQVAAELENVVHDHYVGLHKLQQKMESGFSEITSPMSFA